MDLLTTPYAFNPDEAKAMTKAGADVIVAHVGTTLAGTIGAKDVMSLDEAVAAVSAMQDAVLSIDKTALVICHGGPIASPEDAHYVLSRVKGLAGFYGASSMERLPVEVAITETARRFKALRIA
jgi:predicted TIM-barrel enzyme